MHFAWSTNIHPAHDDRGELDICMSASLFTHYFEDPQKNDRADQRNDKAPNTKARQPLPAECIRHKSTDKRTNHADDDIRQQALIFVRTHELGRDPPRETADNDPSQETHLLHAAPLFVNDTSSIAHLSKDKNRLHETVVDKLKNSWCGLGDSNSWPLPWQGSALTTELNPRINTNFSKTKNNCQVSYAFYFNHFVDIL